MDVFILWSGLYEDRAIFDVYESAGLAMRESHGTHDAMWEESSDGWWRCAWTRVHHEMAGVPITFRMESVRVPVVAGVAILPDGRSVQSASDWVEVPMPPKDGWPAPVRDWSEFCDFDMERRRVRSAA